MILEKARGLLDLGGSVTRMLPSFGENYLIVSVLISSVA